MQMVVEGSIAGNGRGRGGPGDGREGVVSGLLTLVSFRGTGLEVGALWFGQKPIVQMRQRLLHFTCHVTWAVIGSP